jgi:hypothetical protein
VLLVNALVYLSGEQVHIIQCLGLEHDPGGREVLGVGVVDALAAKGRRPPGGCGAARRWARSPALADNPVCAGQRFVAAPRLDYWPFICGVVPEIEPLRSPRHSKHLTLRRFDNAQPCEYRPRLCTDSDQFG